MFTPIDPKLLAARAANVNHDSIHALLDPCTDAGVSQEACDEICDKISTLVEWIKSELATGDGFWAKYQELFGFNSAAKRVVPMNAANLCPEPKVLLEAANLLRIQYNDNVAQQTRTRRGKRVQQLELARKWIAEGVNLDDFNDVALIRNSSEGNNAVVCGYRDWDPTANRSQRENVVIWTENHPTNLESWRLRAKWSSREPLFDIIEVEWAKDASDADILAAFTRRIDERTRFVSYTETSNGSGFRIPEPVIRAIWEHVERNYPRCHVHVDGTMRWGARAVNLAEPYCHSFVSSAHKWFMGPKETAMLYMDPRKALNFAPSIYAYDYRIEVGPWELMPRNAQRFALLGQRDDVNLITMALTQMLWTVLQLRRPYERVAKLAKLLEDSLLRSDTAWKFVTPTDPTRSSGVVYVEAPSAAPMPTLYDYLYDEHGIAGSGNRKTMRLCPHLYNTEADIHAAVEGMNAWRRLAKGGEGEGGGL